LQNESISIDQLPRFSSANNGRWMWFFGAGILVLLSAVALWNFGTEDNPKRSYSQKHEVAKAAIQVQQEKFIIPKALDAEVSVEVDKPKNSEAVRDEPTEEVISMDYIQPISDIERLKEHEEGKLKLATLYPYFYAHNYKIRDYSERSKQWDMQQENLRRIEDPLRSQVLQDYYEKAPYYKELERAMKYFRKGAYTKSYPLFAGILRQFPDDENALFYGGLSAYKLSRFGKASKLFSKALAQRGGVFYEEALWYLALTLEATGNARSDSLFCVIQQYDSFYAENAEDKIGDCE